MSIVRESFLKNHLSWTESFKAGLSKDGKGNYIPWMPYSLIQYLDENLKKDEMVFEYGFGASSIYFAKKVKQVISAESNPRWHEMMTGLVKDSKVNNIEAILMPDALENEKYENLAVDFAKDNLTDSGFDWIIIDSLKRAKCTKQSIGALKKGGKILLDDSQRSNYQKIYEFMIEKGFQCQEFEDIAPGQLRVKKAWIFS